MDNLANSIVTLYLQNKDSPTFDKFLRNYNNQRYIIALINPHYKEDTYEQEE